MCCCHLNQTLGNYRGKERLVWFGRNAKPIAFFFFFIAKPTAKMQKHSSLGRHLSSSSYQHLLLSALALPYFPVSTTRLKHARSQRFSSTKKLFFSIVSFLISNLKKCSLVFTWESLVQQSILPCKVGIRIYTSIGGRQDGFFDSIGLLGLFPTVYLYFLLFF